MNPALPASSRFLSLEQYVAQFDQNAIEWFFAHGIYIVLTIIIAIILLSLIDLMSSNIAKLLPAPTHLVTKAAQTQRRDTLTRIFASVLRSLVWIAAIVISFSELGFNITPFLAAAGAAGIAVGFGGQYLARDLITGFFVTLENQYRLGDYVCFEKTCGYVESINLRMTVLRDFDGTVYNVPHGTITRTANYSKGGGRIFLDFVVSYDNDMQKVIDMINRVGKEVVEDPHFKKMIATAPYFLRVEQFTDQGMVMKIAGSTASGKQ